ncbi:Sortase family protein [Amycolatopsis marina]|uniref:Sortase family protein n=1 Tax=Amycolatopsis marina TaxID=490629 RepID=A0A1I0ZVN4_9PSEU|nr:class F sortase [Amycolatopsis marina]SFB28348.1 Sortase family protein [Amycolatopsis marina]
MDDSVSPSTPDESGRTRRPRRRAWLAAALGLLAVAVTLAGVVVLGAPEPPPPAPVRAVPTTGAELAAETTAEATVERPVATVQRPGTVRLPEGGTARLVRRELTDDGTLPIPDSLEEATWWGAGLGAERGAALLSGHVNWNRVKGPFDELWRNRPGQEVRVVDTEGGAWTYRITEVVTVDKHDLPSVAERLFGQDGPHRLVLVTCGGDYVGGTDGYSDNRIATAELVRRP